MNSKRTKSADNVRPNNLEDNEQNIRPDEDYRIWCRSDGEEVFIRARKIYLEEQIQWVFELKKDALLTLRKSGLRAPHIGAVRYPGAALISFIDNQTEVASA